MTLRIVVAIASLSFAFASFAHNSPEHERDNAKLKPTTCEQYADRENYSNDLTDKDIKALKDACDTEKTSDKPAKDDKQDE